MNTTTTITRAIVQAAVGEGQYLVLAFEEFTARPVEVRVWSSPDAPYELRVSYALYSGAKPQARLTLSDASIAVVFAAVDAFDQEGRGYTCRAPRALRAVARAAGLTAPFLGSDYAATEWLAAVHAGTHKLDKKTERGGDAHLVCLATGSIGRYVPPILRTDM